jgi:acyl carrier protein
MEREEIKEIVRKIIADSVENPDLLLSDDLKPGDVDGWTSMSQAMIIKAIENNFNIKFKLRDLRNFVDIKSLLDIINSKLNESSVL